MKRGTSFPDNFYEYMNNTLIYPLVKNIAVNINAEPIYINKSGVSFNKKYEEPMLITI